MPDTDRKAFICGFPARHSRSPIIHNYWLKLYGIAGSYGMNEVDPAEFTGFLKALSANGYVGCNVTIPHKEVAFQLVDHRDEAAEAIGAVNTVWLENGALYGSNTDGYGFAANLDERAPGWDQGKVATVLGAGGAARAIIHALISRDFDTIRIINRTVARAQALCDHFGAGTSAHGWDEFQDLLSDCDLLVNTTSLGMEGGDSITFDLAALPDTAVVTDIVYIPLETPILKLAAERGLRTVDGLGMLLHQAVPGFERWFGKRPDVTEELRALIIADMEKAH